MTEEYRREGGEYLNISHDSSYSIPRVTSGALYNKLNHEKERERKERKSTGKGGHTIKSSVPQRVIYCFRFASCTLRLRPKSHSFIPQFLPTCCQNK